MAVLDHLLSAENAGQGQHRQISHLKQATAYYSAFKRSLGHPLPPFAACYGTGEADAFPQKLLWSGQANGLGAGEPARRSHCENRQTPGVVYL